LSGIELWFPAYLFRSLITTLIVLTRSKYLISKIPVVLSNVTCHPPSITEECRQTGVARRAVGRGWTRGTPQAQLVTVNCARHTSWSSVTRCLRGTGSDCGAEWIGLLESLDCFGVRKDVLFGGCDKTGQSLGGKTLCK
jgi:hypothetical protein